MPVAQDMTEDQLKAWAAVPQAQTQPAPPPQGTLDRVRGELAQINPYNTGLHDKATKRLYRALEAVNQFLTPKATAATKAAANSEVFRPRVGGEFDPSRRELATSGDVFPFTAESEQRLRSPNQVPGSEFGPPAPYALQHADPDQLQSIPADRREPRPMEEMVAELTPKAVAPPKAKGMNPYGPKVAKKDTEMPAGTRSNPTALIDDDKDLKEMKDIIKQFESKKRIDLSPLLALTDSWTGSNLKAGYNRPMSDEEREQVVMSLKERAAQKEADMRYKKAYLASMQQQDDTRILLKKMDNDTDITKANIAAASRAKGPADPALVGDKLRKRNSGLLKQVAFQQYGNRANPKDKTYVNMADLVHQNALETAENAFEAGAVPSVEAGYQLAVQEMLKLPSGGQKEEE